MASAQGQRLPKSLLERHGIAGGRTSQATTPPIGRRLTAALVGQARLTPATPLACGGIAPSALTQDQRTAQRWRPRTDIMEKRSGLALKTKKMHGDWKLLAKGEKSLLERRSIGESTFVAVSVVNPRSVDGAMVQYTDFLCQHSRAVDSMEKVRAAWEAIYDDHGRRGHLRLPRLSRALRVFRCLVPNQVGWPLPEECLFVLARGAAAAASTALGVRVLSSVLHGHEARDRREDSCHRRDRPAEKSHRI